MLDLMNAAESTDASPINEFVRVDKALIPVGYKEVVQFKRQTFFMVIGVAEQGGANNDLVIVSKNVPGRIADTFPVDLSDD